MPKWDSIDGVKEGLTVATHLDPLPSSHHPSNLGLYLRVNALLWGRLLIPETFLLHNERLHRMLSEGSDARKDFEEFLNVGLALVTRNNREWNAGFEAHWEESNKTGNSLLIEGEIGRRFAQYLDNTVPNSHSRSYSSTTRARSFPDLFEESLKKTFENKGLRQEACAGCPVSSLSFWVACFRLCSVSFQASMAIHLHNLRHDTPTSR